MVLKSITNKIDPIDVNEKCFYEAFLKTRSVDVDPRSLTFYFINESTSYPEASVLAQSAISWAEELDENYKKFESNAKCIACCDEDAFSTYCLHKNWKLKKNTKDIIARDKMKFKARFELSSKRVFMSVEEDDPLYLMQVLNELGGS